MAGIRRPQSERKKLAAAGFERTYVYVQLLYNRVPDYIALLLYILFLSVRRQEDKALGIHFGIEPKLNSS